jgi:hypothetical protein
MWLVSVISNAFASAQSEFEKKSPSTTTTTTPPLPQKDSTDDVGKFSFFLFNLYY